MLGLHFRSKKDSPEIKGANYKYHARFVSANGPVKTLTHLNKLVFFLCAFGPVTAVAAL